MNEIPAPADFDPALDPDIAAEMDRQKAFDAVHAWPPSGTPSRPRMPLRPWSIDREAALGALLPPTLGSAELDTALVALWLASHDEDDITRLRIQPPLLQRRTIADWCREHVLVSERGALLQVINELFRAADECKTLPAYEGGGRSGNAPRP